jgi:tetratricopeptide (TPR) repeat protein
MSKTGIIVLFALAATALVYFLWFAGSSGPFPENVVDRELGSCFFKEERYEEASEALQRVVQRPAPEAQDWVNLACVEIAALKGDVERARDYLDQAEQVDSDLPSMHYCRALLAKRDFEMAAAQEHFARVVSQVDDDPATLLFHAETYLELGDLGTALKKLGEIVDRGRDFGGAYYAVAVYRLGLQLRRSKDPSDQERGKDLLRHRQELEEEGLQLPARELELGTLARVVAPPPEARRGERGDALLAWKELPDASDLFPEAGTVQAVRLADLDGDFAVDLVALGSNGVFLARQTSEGRFEVSKLDGDSWTHVALGDLRNSSRQSLLLWNDQACRLLVSTHPEWQDQTAELPADLRPRDAVFADMDHEGDLDLVVATELGLRLLRNDGFVASPEGEESTTPPGPVQWGEVSQAASMPTGPCDWVQYEDFDNDQDLDLMVGTEDALLLISNLRRNRFELLTRPPLLAAPLLADLNHDGLVDLLPTDATGWWRNCGGNSFVKAALVAEVQAPVGPSGNLVDVNLDGEWDLSWTDEQGHVALRLGPLTAPGAEQVEEPSPEFGTNVSFLADQQPLIADLDQDGDLDLVAVNEGKVGVRRATGSVATNSLRVVLSGRKDNRRAVGVWVEVRAGLLYQRFLARGEPLLVGLGAASQPEIVKLTWPNGVVQCSISPPPGAPVEVVQKEGFAGSCPYLYTFNGVAYEFISDVLGITPLGLPMERGVYVPPDHDELVRIEEEQLRPVDGEYRLSVTEELREVTYLDRAQLWVVDHPQEVEIHPEERFCFPPFPPLHVHSVREALPVEKAVGSDGQDWTAALADVDRQHAIPFQQLPSQYQGLVSPHHLDLTLPEAVKTAKKVRLLMTGWLYWSNASVNVAAGFHPSYSFVPPILMVPDAEGGGWRETGPPVGFPAGKTKTMVLDITDLINREDPRLRVFSTIRLYWDSIRVAVDDDDAPLQITKLEPAAAELLHRGFSQPLFEEAEDQSERYDFHALQRAPWNQHPGMLTRYGEVLPLLAEIDDCFAIFSSGDAIDLRFSAATIEPVAEGMARTYLLFLDGWAKDGDPNTTWAQQVKPLPFHGMSGYPYGEDESYPGGAKHAAYQKEWNTRPGRRLLPDLTLSSWDWQR